MISQYEFNFSRLLTWTLINGLVFGSGVIGYQREVPWLLNIFKFATWFAVVCGMVVMLVPGEKLEPIAKKPLSAPRWLDVSFDVVMILWLAAIGWFVTASFYLVVPMACARIVKAKEVLK